MIKFCEVCQREFKTKPSHYKRRKTCSFKCRFIYQREKPSKLKGRKFPGRITLTSFKKNDSRLMGKNNHKWKDAEVGYMALHARNIRYFGQPKLCEHCGTKDAIAYDWANISQEYKLERDDWMRLCRSCHRKYDFITRKKQGIKNVKEVFGL